MWIKGLFLEGAGWDKRTSCLVDSRAMELVYPMPTIHFKPVEGKRRSTKGKNTNYFFTHRKIHNYNINNYVSPK